MALLDWPDKNVPTFPQLAKQMKAAIRAEAQKNVRFKYGAMRFLFCPKSEDARKYLGGFDEDFVDIDVAAHIESGKSMTLPAGYWIDGAGEVDCYGYAGMKIQGCAYAVNNGFGRRSSDCPEGAVIPGRCKSRGAVVFDLQEMVGYGYDTNTTTWLRVYVAVSGGTGEMDARCALTVQPILETFAKSKCLGKDHQFFIVGPES